MDQCLALIYFPAFRLSTLFFLLADLKFVSEILLAC